MEALYQSGGLRESVRASSGGAGGDYGIVVTTHTSAQRLRLELDNKPCEQHGDTGTEAVEKKPI